ncbi:MAG: hypothetical protein DMF88_16635 [Acidobacteria bacterium]|nr:MAG: hypothetical protein DMF88_16635 [Acidobacteriota bacterium]
MVERRDVIGGGLAAGLAAAFGRPAEAQTRRDSGEATADSKAADAIDKLRDALEHAHESADVAQIRAQQRTFLKANQKFPDYIDVGIDIWERMHDWHVRNRQPLTIVRTNDGRYGMVFGVTTLILMPQQTGNYISWGYDTR